MNKRPSAKATRTLPERPNLEHSKGQARNLLKAFKAEEPAAVEEVNHHFSDADPATFQLAQAQLVVARAHGFASWNQLKEQVEGGKEGKLYRAIVNGDLQTVGQMLEAEPDLVNRRCGDGYFIHLAVVHRQLGAVRLLLAAGANPHQSYFDYYDITNPVTMAEDREYHEISACIKEWIETKGEREEKRLEAKKRKMLKELDEANKKQPSLDEGGGEKEKKREHVLLETMIKKNLGQDLVLDNWAARKVVLQEAIEEGNEELVSSILLQVDCSDSEEFQLINPNKGGLLTKAVTNNRLAIVRLMLEKGCDPDERTQGSHGMPLVYAVRDGHYDIARLLLEKGADPNAEVTCVGTPIYFAYSTRRKEMRALLESYGAKATLFDIGVFGDEDAVGQMLSQDPDETTMQSLLRSTALGGHPRLVKQILEHIDWANDDSRWFGILIQPMSLWGHHPERHFRDVLRRCYLECFLALLEHGVDPNVSGPYGIRPLHYLIRTGEVRYFDIYGGSGFRTAQMMTDEERLSWCTHLRFRGADFTVRDEILKSTPMGWAARWGRENLVKAFITVGIDPIEPDAEPWSTPLAWAKKKGHEEILALLGSA